MNHKKLERRIEELELELSILKSSKIAEEKLHANLSLIEATLQSIHNGILVVSQEGTIIRTNVRFAEMWGIPDDILSSGDDKTLLDYVIGQLADPEEFIAKVRELYQNPDAESSDLIFFIDGRIFERISKPMYVGVEPKGRVWSFLDITERRQAEQALRESEKEYRNIFDNIGEGIGFVNPSEEFVIVNPAAKRIFGEGGDKLVGKSLKEFLNEEQFSAMSNQTNIHKKGQKSTYEMEITRIDGEKRNLVITAVPQLDENKKFIGTLGIFRDITEHKQVEDALQNERRLLRTVIDLIPDAIYVKDTQGRKILANPKEVQLSGKSSEDEVMAKTDSDLYSNIEAKRALAEDNLVIETGQAIKCNDATLIDKNGKLHWLSGSKVPILDGNGKISGIIGLTHDITERKQNEDSVRESEKKLFQLNADKDRFLAILAHDLKGPFNSLLGFSELLTLNIRHYDVDRIENLVGFINKSAQSAFNLLENLLMWTQSQSGKIPYNPQKLKIKDIYKEVLETLQAIAETKNISINYLATEKINIFADKDMLETILRNLVSNAIKFTRPGGRIDIFAKKRLSEVTISVSDNGVGIAPATVNKLFDVLQIQSTKGTSNESGTGLGLLLCKEFVEKHGGKIWVESQVEKGSEFKFTLPMQPQ